MLNKCITEVLKKQIKLFINSKHRNKWLLSTYVRLYIKKCKYINSQDVDYINVGVIEIHTDYRNKGYLKYILGVLSTYTEFKYIYIECVSNRDLYEFLVREDWTCVQDNCFYTQRENLEKYINLIT